MTRLKATLMFTTCYAFCIVAHAQESSTVLFDDEEVEVSEEQADQIAETEDAFTSELEAMEKELEKLTEMRTAKWREFEARKLSFLTPLQRDELSARRFKSGDATLREQQANDIEHLRELLPILEKLKTRESMTLLEGPERKRMEMPKAPGDGQSVEYVGEHFFFREPLVLNREDELSVLSTASSYKSFRPFRVFVGCGGFHPDLNIRMTTQHGVVQILVCFGCKQVLFVDGENRALVEIEGAAYRTLFNVCRRNFRQRAPVARGK